MELEEIDEELREISGSSDDPSIDRVEEILENADLDYDKVLESSIKGVNHVSHKYRLGYDGTEYLLRVQSPDRRPGSNESLEITEYSQSV